MDLKPTTDPLSSFFYVVGGWICVGFAVLGAILPLLPTTPFLLLASWCFYRDRQESMLGCIGHGGLDRRLMTGKSIEVFGKPQNIGQ